MPETPSRCSSVIRALLIVGSGTRCNQNPANGTTSASLLCIGLWVLVCAYCSFRRECLD